MTLFFYPGLQFCAIIRKLTDHKHHQAQRKYITTCGVVFIEDFWSHIRVSASYSFHIIIVLIRSLGFKLIVESLCNANISYFQLAITSYIRIFSGFKSL